MFTKIQQPGSVFVFFTVWIVTDERWSSPKLGKMIVLECRPCKEATSSHAHCKCYRISLTYWYPCALGASFSLNRSYVFIRESWVLLFRTRSNLGVQKLVLPRFFEIYCKFFSRHTTVASPKSMEGSNENIVSYSCGAVKVIWFSKVSWFYGIARYRRLHPQSKLFETPFQNNIGKRRYTSLCELVTGHF